MKKHYFLSLFFIPLFSFSADIYKGVDDQGHVVYSTRPQSSRQSEKIKLPPLSVVNSATNSMPISSPPSNKNNPPSSTVPSVPADSSLLEEYKRVQDQLIQAISAKDSGIEPLEDERTFNGKNKHSFLNDKYQQRQNALAKQVQDLQNKMNDLAIKLKDQGLAVK